MPTGSTAISMFGAGCFWGVEETFRTTPGVVATAVGYSGGHLANPTYRDVCAGGSGHAEVVRVEFDESRISYDALLEVFWGAHDPTTPNRQGPDVGAQYRSVIFTFSEAQAQAAREAKARTQSSGRFTRPIVTLIEPAREFYRAEENHQQYVQKRGVVHCRVP